MGWWLTFAVAASFLSASILGRRRLAEAACSSAVAAAAAREAFLVFRSLTALLAASNSAFLLYNKDALLSSTWRLLTAMSQALS